MKLTEKDIALLNSNRGLRSLLYKANLNTKQALKYTRYYNALTELQKELVRLQTWLINNNKRIVFVFEGRDAAGKGGAINRFIQYLNPRHLRVVSLRKPSESEAGSWYLQRYIQHLPVPGEMVFFDRSWYNRAIIEPVNKLCTMDEYHRFMNQVNDFERMLVNDGIILFKFYFSISKKEQAKRLKELKTNPLKEWKYGKLDEYAQLLWSDYTRFKEIMFDKTHTEKAPWRIIDADDKHKARLNAIKHVLDSVPHREDYHID